MYATIDKDKSEFNIELIGVNLQMTGQYVRDLRMALHKALQIEQTNIAHKTYDKKSKAILIELMERLDRVNNAGTYTTTEKEALEQKVKTSYG